MGKAGGIIAIVAGVFGVLAALATLFIGGLSAAFSANGADTVLGLGWGGVGFSFLVIVFGAVALARPGIGGAGTIASALAGAVLGGTLVAIFMALALIGGLLTVFSRPAPGAGGKPVQAEEGGRGLPAWGWAAGGVALASVVVVAATGFAPGGRGSTASPSGSGGESAGAPLRLRLGETGRGDRFEVTVNRFEIARSLRGDFGTRQADPGTVFALLGVAVKCIDQESRHYSPGDLFVTVGGKQIKYDARETIFGLKSPIGQINPFTQESGFLVFKVPEEFAGSPMSWEPWHHAGMLRVSLQEPASAAAAASPANGRKGALTGSYATSAGSSLKVLQSGDGAIRFELAAIGQPGPSGIPNTGDISGTAVLDGQRAMFRDLASDCALTLTFGERQVQVAQQGSCGFGLGVVADGAYAKTGAAAPVLSN